MNTLKYRCIRFKILLYWCEIWNTSPLGGLVDLTICKIEKNSIIFLDEKMQNILQGTHFGYIDVSDLKFYSIILNFEPQMHKEFY
jgi:hypothetical protein